MQAQAVNRRLIVATGGAGLRTSACVNVWARLASCASGGLGGSGMAILGHWA